MKKKREGSVILMVLMISTILIILSSVISSSLVFTSKGTVQEKRKSDYIYAAEGGLDLGIQKYNELGKEAFKDGALIPSFLRNCSEEIDRVEVTYEIDPIDATKGKIVSSVYKVGQPISNQVLFRISVPTNSRILGNSNDVLKNIIYSSGSVTVDSIGASNLSQSNITYNSGAVCNVPVSNGSHTGADNIYVENTVRPTFIPSIVTARVDDLEVNSIDELWDHVDAKEMSQSVDNNPSNPVGKIPKGIGKFDMTLSNLGLTEADRPHGLNWGGGYKLIIVDAPKLIINMTSPTLQVSNYIVFCSGEIEIKGSLADNAKATINLTRSNLYGNNVNIKESAVLTANQSPTFPEIGGLISVQTSKLDELLNKYMSSWGAASSTGGASGNDVNFSEIEYEMF